MRYPRSILWFWLLTIGSSAMACAAPLPTTNPSMPITEADAKRIIGRMKEQPVRPARPIVIVGGFREFLTLGPSIASMRLKGVFDRPQIILVSLAWCSSFEECRATIVKAVEKNFPSSDAAATTEVDVIGQSMGGIASAYAADETKPGKHLKIHTLYTLSSPWQGATRADWWAIDDCQRSMRRGSAFLDSLNQATRHFEVVPYTRLGDRTVGEAYTAPRGMTPIWLPAAAFESSHFNGCIDYRAIADIARRLRNETPIAAEIREPLPVTRPTGL